MNYCCSRGQCLSFPAVPAPVRPPPLHCQNWPGPGAGPGAGRGAGRGGPLGAGNFVRGPARQWQTRGGPGPGPSPPARSQQPPVKSWCGWWAGYAGTHGKNGSAVAANTASALWLRSVLLADVFSGAAKISL